MNAPATPVFVHGGWHDGWSWHLVRERLDARGVPSVALDLPMTTLEQDAQVLSDALAQVGGVDPGLAREAATHLRPFQKTGYAVVETDKAAPWRTIPTTYAVCTEDRMIHPDTQRDMAAAAGAEVVEWQSSHSPFLSHPGLVAELVAHRANKAGEQGIGPTIVPLGRHCGLSLTLMALRTVDGLWPPDYGALKLYDKQSVAQLAALVKGPA
jgi:hypothetical protein